MRTIPVWLYCSKCSGKVGISRITNDEMKRIMKTTVDRVCSLLQLRDKDRGEYERLIAFAELQTRSWDPAERTADF